MRRSHGHLNYLSISNDRPGATTVDRAPRPSVVAVARNDDHTREAVARAVRLVVDRLDPPLPTIVRPGDRVLLKVNMGCSGFREPHERVTSHPAYVESIIERLIDCGARVTFGDDVSRTAAYERIWEKTGMGDVARRTGARLIDFVAAGGRETRGFLRYPRTYLMTNLVFEADVIANAANCRSLSPVVLSGAIKNMFGVVLGTRKLRMHALFPDPKDFARVIVDIHRIARPAVSFLDLTSVIEGQGVRPAIQPVGLMCGSTDPVALDTLAAHAIGYESLTIWTTILGNAVGLGCNRLDDISVRGIDWDRFETKRLRYPQLLSPHHEPLMERVTRRVNNTMLRPRPVITPEVCTACGACAKRCPVDAIRPRHTGGFMIDLARCADCGCCLKVCDVGAVHAAFVGIPKLLRTVLGRRHDERSHQGTAVIGSLS